MIDKEKDYYIFEGYNHYTNKPLYRVQGNDDNDNEYVGEWNLSKKIVQKELDELLINEGHYERLLNELKNKGKERFVKGGVTFSKDENEMMSKTMTDIENNVNETELDEKDDSIEEVTDEVQIPTENADEITDTDVEILAPVENTNTNWESFFKDNPTKVLGTEKEIISKFGKKVIRVIGDLEKLESLDLPSVDSHTEIENITSIVIDDVTSNNISPTQFQKNNENLTKSKKTFSVSKKLIEENKEYELFSFDEVDEQYNVGISDDVKSAYVYYLQKISNGTLQGGFLKYDLGFNDKVEKELMSKGVLFYDSSEKDISRRYNPIFLWQSGNIYKKKQKLEENKEFYIENFGEKIYNIHLEKINEVYNLVWNRRLTLNNADVKNRLVLNPTADICTDVDMFKIQSFMAGDFLVQSESVYVSNVDGKEILKPLKDSSRADNNKTIYDYNLQLAFVLYLKKIGSGDRAKSRGIIYTDGMDYEQIYAYYLKNSQRPKSITKEDWGRIKGYASKNGKRLFAHFLEFGLTPKDRERLEFQWNIEFNGNLDLDINKVPIGFQFAKMYNGEFANDIRQEKRRSLVFNMIQGSSLLAYGVGLGKTYCAIYNLAQNLEYGFCKRPLIILPNQVYPQFIKEISGLIPQYKINRLYNLKGVYSFLNQKIDDYSISVCTYEGLEEIAFSDDLDLDFYLKLGTILSSGEEMSQKQKERESEKFMELIGKAKSETSVNFDDENANWDYIVVDEAHNFKKLFTQVRGQAKQSSNTSNEDVKKSYEKTEYNLSSGVPSNRAIRLFFLTQYVQQKSFNGNILMLTATPFTNSPLEVFTMLSYLNYEYLKSINLGNLKQFFDNFAIINVEVVINTQLEPVRKQVFVGWSNVVGLQDLIFKFMDKPTKEQEEKAVNRPNKIVLPLNKKEIDGIEYELKDEDKISTTLSLTDLQITLWETLKEYASGEITAEDLQEDSNLNLTSCGKIAKKVISENPIEEEKVELKELNHNEKGGGARALQCLTYGRQLALSPYLYRFSGLQIEPTYLEYVESSPKMLYVVNCIKSVKEYHEQKGTKISGQVIFMNIGVMCFDYLAEYLIKKIGFNEKEIGVISGSGSRIAKKKYAKSEVQDKFLGRYFNEQTMTFDSIDDSERVKVLIGSASIQEGLNLQAYSSVLYNLYIGFNPTDQIQLEGRIWRQGNDFNNVRIVIPLMENSMDIFMFQKLQEKTKRINEIWARTGKNEIDTTEFNAEELKYELITDSFILAKLTLDEDKQKIDEQINDLNYQYSTIKNVAQIYSAIDSFYYDGYNSYGNDMTPIAFFRDTRVGYMYFILRVFRGDLVPLPMFKDEDITPHTKLTAETYAFSKRERELRYAFTDKQLNYSVKEIIEKMVEFRKDNKIFIPIGFDYDELFKKEYKKGDSVTFNAEIKKVDTKTKEETTTNKELTGIIKVVNEEVTDDFLEVFVKGYEDLFEVSKSNIILKKEKKEKKEFYTIGTKEFTENLLPILYFQYQKTDKEKVFINTITSNNDSIYDVFETISYKNDLPNLKEKQKNFLKDYNSNIDVPTFWALTQSNLFDMQISGYNFNNSTTFKNDIYSGDYIKTYINIEKAERELLIPKGINNAEELGSKLEDLTLEIKDKQEEKDEINSDAYLLKKVVIIDEKRQLEKSNPLRKASNYIQRVKEFKSENVEYKGNEYLDDVKAETLKVKKEQVIDITPIQTETITTSMPQGIDNRIKGLKIALKFAKGDSVISIEKRIKGLEIAQRIKR